MVVNKKLFYLDKEFVGRFIRQIYGRSIFYKNVKMKIHFRFQSILSKLYH
jgi:hypothetical protein